LAPADVKADIRSAMRSAIRSALNVPVVDPVLGAVGNLADQVDDLMTDIRGLNPNQPLAGQISNLLLNRIEDAVENAFGGHNPGIDLKFEASWTYWEFDFGSLKWREKTARFAIDLG